MLSWFWFHFCSPGFIWSEETFHLSKQQVCQCRETVTCLPTEILVFPQVLVLHMHIRTFLKSTKPVFSNNTRICVWFESIHSSHLAALEVWVAPWITPTSHLKLHAWPDSQGCLLVSNNYGREFCTLSCFAYHKHPSKLFTNLNIFGFRVSKPVRKFWKWKLNGPHPQCSPDSKLGVISDLPHDIIVSNKGLVLERSKRAPVNVTGPILQKCCYVCWCSIAFMCFESIFWPLSDSKIQTIVAHFQGRKMLTMLEK